MNEPDPLATEATVALIFALMHGGRVVEGRVDDALATVGLSSPKWIVLQRLVEAGGSLSLGHAAERLACAKSNVTQLVDRLEREGLVQRVPDPLDRRSIFAQITEEGRRRYRAGWQVLGALADGLAAPFTPAERDQLARVLERLDAQASPVVR
jgi:DNA-binding MarR family transcriptional regulator